MKPKRLTFFAVFLLLAAAAMPAQEEIAVTPKGLVTVGTVLHFSAYLKYKEAQCEEAWTGKQLRYFISCDNGSGWKTEFLTPDPTQGWKWYEYTATYTVTQADIDNPSFCFDLYADSGCWGYWHGIEVEKKCPLTKIVIPRIVLQKYFDCSRVPGCPNCRVLDLTWLIRAIGDPLERVQVVLLRNGQRFAVLGEAGPGRRLPAQFRLTLPSAGKGLSRMNQPDQFLLQVLGGNGQVLASEAVALKIH